VEIDGPAAHPLERDGPDAERDNAAVLDGYDLLRIDVRGSRPVSTGD
jgi:very-short-patch-repair endonuclease